MPPPTDEELLDLARRVGDRAVVSADSPSARPSRARAVWSPISSPRSRARATTSLGGLVTYSNEVKIALVDVHSDVLDAHGAVSAQVAEAMAEGARHRLAVDVAVAVTGVAGPDGGTVAKPVGLTYVAVADPAGDDVRRFVWDSDRAGNKRLSAAAALGLVLDRLAEPGT